MVAVNVEQCSRMNVLNVAAEVDLGVLRDGVVTSRRSCRLDLSIPFNDNGATVRASQTCFVELSS